MTSQKTNCEEIENLLDGAKRGNKSNIQIITDSFLGLVKNNYKNLVHGKIDIELVDYIQECNVKIIEWFYIKNKALGQYAEEKGIGYRTAIDRKKRALEKLKNILTGRN